MTDKRREEDNTICRCSSVASKRLKSASLRFPWERPHVEVSPPRDVFPVSLNTSHRSSSLRPLLYYPPYHRQSPSTLSNRAKPKCVNNRNAISLRPASDSCYFSSKLNEIINLKANNLRTMKAKKGERKAFFFLSFCPAICSARKILDLSVHRRQ